MQYIIPRGTSAVQGIPIGRLANLESRVSALEAGGGAGFTKLTTASTIDDSNLIFVFSQAPVYLVINGVWYSKTGGAITWTGTTTVTLSSTVGTNGSIWGFK